VVVAAAAAAGKSALQRNGPANAGPFPFGSKQWRR
jgi:hypothetical protein